MGEIKVIGGIFCNDGVPIPVEDPALKACAVEKMLIVDVDKKKGRLIISTEKPLTEGKKIIFIGSSIFCKEEDRYVNFSFTFRFTARIGVDIIPIPKSEMRHDYLWVNPQITFVKDHSAGHILTFVEVSG